MFILGFSYSLGVVPVYSLLYTHRSRSNSIGSSGDATLSQVDNIEPTEVMFDTSLIVRH